MTVATMPTLDRPPREKLYRADFAVDTISLEDAKEGQRPTLVLHFARFNEWVEVNSILEGHFMERFLPGSFQKTLTERASKIKVLFDHGRDFLGKQILGDIVALYEQETSAYAEVELFEGLPPLFLSGLRAGKYGASFFGAVIDEHYDPRPKRSAHNPKGLQERSVTEAKVFELGPCTFAVYDNATTVMRSVTDDFHPAIGRLAADPEKLKEIAEHSGVSLANVEVPSFEQQREVSRSETRRFERATEYVTTTAWAMHPDALSTILEILGERNAGYKPTPEEIRERLGVRADVALDLEQPEAQHLSTQAVAVIPVAGAIVPKANLFTETSGTMSVQGFQTEFRAALADPDVSSILLDIHSPGGSVDMIPELGAEILAARGQKPITAVANTLAASAAYWIASAADEIVVSPSAQIGSIGVIATHEDWSARDAKEGIKKTYITAGAHKGEAGRGRPLSDDAEAHIQRSVDSFYEMFVSAVAEGRGVTTEKVTEDFGQGRMVLAADAVSAGMADRVASFDETLARLEAEAATGRDTETETTEPERSVATTPDREPESSEAATHTEEPESSEATTPRSRDYLAENKERPSWLIE